MSRARWIVGALSLGIVGVGAIVAACGGEEQNQCGPGTVLVGGVCQVVSNDGSPLDVTPSPDGSNPDDATPLPDSSLLPDGGPSADASVDAPPNRCPYGKGPVMAEIPNLIWDAGSFCIDTTEVSESQYEQFLQSIGGPTGDAGAQPAGCGQNLTYAPGPTIQYGTYTYDPAKNPNLPVRGIDWCDAYAYCRWAGKRLCDRYDKSTPAITDAGSWKLYETNITCAQNGSQKYAYGSSFQAGFCAPGPLGDASPDPVGTSKCRGTTTPYSTVFDTSGNLFEWYGARSPNGDPTSGGSSQCTVVDGQLSTYERTVYRGVRCCAD